MSAVGATIADVAPNPFDADPAQAQVLEHSTGSLLVVGAAGTGKTTVLRERMARAIESGADPERIALVVGSARAREDARGRLMDRLGRSLPALRVTTIHGLAFSLVSERFAALGYPRPPDVLDAARQFAVVERLLEQERDHPERWPAFGALLGLHGFADEIRQLLLRAAERLLTPEEMQLRAERRGLGGWMELTRFATRYREELAGIGALDFAGLLVRASEAATAGPPAFDEVLVDDHQDSTLAAERLLSSLGARTLVVAGNEAAHVFSFQGTTLEPLRRLRDDASVVSVRLETNHRSPGGVAVEAWTAAHASEEHRAIARELRRIHVEDGVAWGDLSVVVRRQSGDAQALLRGLDDARIPRVASEPGLSPAAAPGTRPYILALRWIIASPETRDELADVVLTSELGGLAPASARALLRISRARRESAARALEITDGLGERERFVLTALRHALAEAERFSSSAEDAMRVLWQRLPCSAALVEAAESSVEARADLQAVRALTEAAARWATSSDPSVQAFLGSLGSGEGAPEAAGVVGRGDAVRVLTAHAAVGMEFDTVIVAGAQEANFPSLERPEPMFDLNVLERTATRSETNRARIADERRLFGSVLSRARRRVLLTATHPHGSISTEGPVSRFADELDVEWRPAPVPPYADPVSTEEAAAAWRRELADLDAVAPSRIAALDGLLALGVDPRRWWFRRDWSDAVPRREPNRLSYSRLDRLENCELQFALSEELGLDPGGGYQAWVGRLVHGLIERIERGQLERSREAFVAAIEAAWEPERFPSYAISEAERRNAVEVLVPNWFLRYGDRPAEEGGTERYFTFDLDGAVIRGKIDRIGPDAAGRRRITDFKTGKADGAGDASRSLQLGIYYLAVGECDELAEFRPVDAVELAYLAGTKADAAEPTVLEWRIETDEEARYVTEMRSRVEGLVERVRMLTEEGSYTASTAADCFFCRFQTMCPRYAEGRPVFETASRVSQAASP